MQQKAAEAGALPQTPMGQLTALHQILSFSWF